MNIKIPNEALYIINTLRSNGFEAYVVGGCVRDSVLGKEPKDWDICTVALPEQTMSCFKGSNIIETGLQHGTITLVLNHIPFEVTTYRVDGEYSDNRRPDSVKFVRDLKEDLARRDFTINAMAYDPHVGIMDFFGGLDDLRAGVIRCVGSADKRFQEDALRVMRALRFASVLGFRIEPTTKAALFENKSLLKNIAVERISNELNKLITGGTACKVLYEYIQVVTEIIPELTALIGFKQNHPYHWYDVLNHTLISVDNAPKDTVLRLTMLLHDIAKPTCYTEEDGVGHFYGHPQVGFDVTKKILQRLRYDNDTITKVTELVLYHDAELLATTKNTKKWLNKLGEERLRQLIEVKRADVKAQTDVYCAERLEVLDKVSVLIDEILAQQQCFSLKDLAVNGRDLMAAGVPEGVKIGVTLNRLINMVIDEEIENDKAKLLDIALRM